MFVENIGHFLNLLRTDFELLLHKSTLSCLCVPCLAFVEIGCTELLVLYTNIC